MGRGIVLDIRESQKGQGGGVPKKAQKRLVKFGPVLDQKMFETRRKVGWDHR